MNIKIIKPLFIAVGLLFAVNTIAQSSKRTSAYYAYKDWQEIQDKSSDKAKKSILEAKTLIDECYAYSSEKFTGSKDAKTLYYKGQIYTAFQFYLTDESMKEYNPMNLVAEGMKAYKAHIDLPNKKSKDDKTDEIKTQFLLMRQQAVIGSEALFKSANEKLQNRDSDGAKADFKMAMMGYNSAGELMKTVGVVDTNSYYAAGLCGYYAEEWKGAIANLKEAVKYGFGEPGSSTLLAQSYFSMEKGEEGLKVLEEASKKYPKNADLYITEGNYWLTQKENDKASAAYDKAIAVNPNNETVYYTAGAVNFENEKYEVAEKYLLKAVELKPDYVDALYNLGALYNNMAFDIEKEVDDLAGATLSPEKVEEKNNLLKKAVDYYERVRKIEPNDKQTLLQLYKTYGALQMTEKSKEIEDILNN